MTANSTPSERERLEEMVRVLRAFALRVATASKASFYGLQDEAKSALAATAQEGE